VTAPFFSIVVPTHRRIARLCACLEALAALDYPSDRFEVIVVNDGCDGLSADQVAAFASRMQLVNVDQPWAGPAAARNTGASRARGAYVVFTDDDCTPARDWLRVLELGVQKHPGALVGGRAINGLHDDLCATASQMLVDYLYQYYQGGTARGPRFFTSNNMCVPNALLRTVGGFDESFTLPAGEDREFCDRWVAAGHPLVYEPRAIVLHQHAMSLRSFTRQHLNYGRGAWAFHRARARRASGPVAMEPWSFYARLVAFPLTQGRGSRAPVLSALLVWSQVINVTGYFLARARSGR
jgi:glycosyltransferase involved in cell wall biosynthesis